MNSPDDRIWLLRLPSPRRRQEREEQAGLRKPQKESSVPSLGLWIFPGRMILTVNSDQVLITRPVTMLTHEPFVV